MACATRRENDELVCSCGLRWDVGDSEPPVCPGSKYGKPAPLPEVCNSQQAPPAVTVTVPVELPATVADEMFRTMQYARGTGSDPVEAMRRAYRVFLDRCAL